jgi:eukaryotic-like serine/threonine-protein kinase
VANAAGLEGRHLGRYRVIEPLGAGGMGVVFRAYDSRLERDVALKVLPDGAVADEADRRRLRREALALSRITHPHIATVFDFDSAEGIDFLVTELIEGAPLDRAIAHGRLRESEVASIGSQLAAALQAAHERGVVHRDLKPSNIMLTPDGQVKVVDFGIAQVTPAGDRTLARTEGFMAGAGTLPYMAPEQLRNEQIDARADLWAAGCVLYELALGRRPFDSLVPAQLADQILRSEPPAPRALRPDLSPQFEFVVLKCLEKQADLRYQSARDLEIDLRRVSSAHTQQVAPAPSPARPQWRTWGAGAALLLAFAAAAFFALRPDPTVTLVYEKLTDFDDLVRWPRISPDGRMLAFLRNRQLYVKMLPGGEPVQLTHDPADKCCLAFSPDGSRVAFDSGNDVWVVPAHGGTPRLLLANASALTWVDDRQVLFSEYKSGIHLAVVTSDESRGGLRDVYVPPTDQGMAHQSYLSPDKRHVLVQEMDATGNLPCRVVPFDGSSPGFQVGPPSGSCGGAAWSPDGRYMYLEIFLAGERHLWRQRFPDGTPEQITFGATFERWPSVTVRGDLVATVGTMTRSLFVRDASGERRLTEEGAVSLPTLSTDGSSMYYIVDKKRGRAFLEGEVWRIHIASGEREPLLPGTFVTHYSVASDAVHIAYTVAGPGGESSLWVARLDRRHAPRQLMAAGAHWPHFSGADAIVFLASDGPSKFLSRVSLDGGVPERLLDRPVSYFVNLSPDGEWAALWMPTAIEGEMAVVLQPLARGIPFVICQPCGAWSGTEQGAPLVSWDLNQKFAFFGAKYFHAMAANQTIAVPVPSGGILPPLPSEGVSSPEQLLELPGAIVVEHSDVFPLRSPEDYLFMRTTARGNAYLLRAR